MRGGHSSDDGRQSGVWVHGKRFRRRDRSMSLTRVESSSTRSITNYTHRYEHGTRVSCHGGLNHPWGPAGPEEKLGVPRKFPERGGSSRILQDPLGIPPGTRISWFQALRIFLGDPAKKNLTLHMGGARGALPGDPGAKNSWLQALGIFSWGPALTPSSHLTLMGCKVPEAPKYELNPMRCLSMGL